MDAINAKLPPTSTTSLQLKNLKELYEIDMKGARFVFGALYLLGSTCIDMRKISA